MTIPSEQTVENSAEPAAESSVRTVAEASARRPHGLPVLDSLTGLRGLAAMMVFCFHVTTFELVFTKAGHLRFDSLDRPIFLTMAGNFAVSSFFILSGFVLALTTRPGTSLANFYAKRVGKLCPIYFVTTIVAIVAILVIGMPISLSDIVAHLTLLQSWIPNQAIYTGINPVTWSISTEAFFYLLFPASFFLVKRMSSRALYVTLGVAICLEFGLPLYVEHFFTVINASGGYFNTSTNGGSMTYWFTLPFPPYRFLEFLAGMTCCVLMLRGDLPTIKLRWACALAALGYVIGTYSPGPEQRTAIGLIPLAVLVTSLAQADLGQRPSLLRWKLFVELGKLSYGMYAIQLLVYLPTQPFVLRGLSALLGVSVATLGNPIAKAPISAAYFVAIAVIAIPIHRKIEVPAYDYAKGLFRSRKGSGMFADPIAPVEAP